MSFSSMTNPRYVIKAILVLMGLIGVWSCSQDDVKLAEFDGGTVNEHEFLNHYLKYLSVTGLEDNLPDRKKMLRSVLHEKLILKDWHSKLLDRDPSVKTVLKRQEEQAILDAWWKKISEVDQEPGPQELAQMLVLERSRFHVEESIYLDQESAELAYNQWQSKGLGVGFRDLGFITLEDVHPRLAAVLYKLDEGDVTSPIRLGNGYSLIKLVEKKAPIFIRPREFAAARQRLSQEWQVTQSDSLIDAYTKGKTKSLGITFNDEGCDALLTMVQQVPKDKMQTFLVESDIALLPVCLSSDEQWTIGMIAPHLQDSKSEHLQAVMDRADLQNIIAGILVRRALLAEAIDVGLHKENYTVEAIQKRQDLWRIKTWQQHFSDTVKISQTILTQSNQASVTKATKIPLRDVELLMFQDSGSAQNVYEQLSRGVSSEKFKKEVAAILELPDDGNLGWVTVAELGQAAKLVFGQELNTWTKPWHYDGNSYIFRSNAEQYESVNQNLSAAKLEEQIRASGALAQLEKALHVMEKDSHVKIYEERIKEIPFIQISGPNNES